MIRDLEAEEFVDGSDDLRVAAGDLHVCARGHFLERERQCRDLTLHRVNAGNGLGVVDQARQGEITLGEEVRDVLQVFADLFDRRRILRVLCRHLDAATIFRQDEVVRRRLLIEAHELCAACIERGVVLVMLRGSG